MSYVERALKVLKALDEGKDSSNQEADSAAVPREVLQKAELTEPLPPSERHKWLKTPLGPAKLWGFLEDGRVGIVLRGSDRVRFIRQDQLELYDRGRPESWCLSG